MATTFSRANGQWRAYCKAKNIIPELHNAVEKYTKKLIEDYHDSINANTEQKERGDEA